MDTVIIIIKEAQKPLFPITISKEDIKAVIERDRKLLMGEYWGKYYKDKS